MLKLTPWKILGISVLIHACLIIAFRELVLFSPPHLTFPQTRFTVFELPAETLPTGETTVAEKFYRVPSASVDIPDPVLDPVNIQESNPTASAEELLYDKLLKTKGEGINFFGLKLNKNKDHIIFLIDISGSMLQRTGTSTRLNLVYEEIKQALASLEPNQQFNLVLFAERVSYFSEQPVFASRANILKAYSYLGSDVNCGGSTDLQGGLRQALAMRPDQILLLSDGLPTSTQPAILLTETKYLREKTLPKTQIHAVGFYLMASSAEENFLIKLTKQNNGTYLRWSPPIDVSQK